MKRPFSTAVLLLASVMAWGKVTLPDIVSDNMVLQQQTQARLWGWAEPQTEITVHTSWNEKTYLTRTDEKGRWLATVDTPSSPTTWSLHGVFKMEGLIFSVSYWFTQSNTYRSV